MPNEKKEFELFTIENGRAKEHTVKIGLANEREAEMSAPDLQPGQQVVTVGNYELQDGMAVEIAKSK